MVAVRCDLCGHTFLFDAQMFGSQDRILEGEDAPGQGVLSDPGAAAFLSA